MARNLKRKAPRKMSKTKKKQKNMSFIKKTALRAAAGTLGFIAGNASGAVTGTQLANRYIDYKNNQYSAVAKHRSKQVVSISRENDLTIHKIPGYVFKKKKEKLTKGLGDYNYKSMSQRVLSNLQGQQAYGYVEPILHTNHLAGDVSVARNDLVRFTDSLWNMNPYSKSYGAANDIHQNTGPDAFADGDKLHVKSVDSTVGIINLTKLPVEISLYYMTPISNIEYDVDAVWSQALQAQTYGQKVKNAAQNIGVANFPNIKEAAGYEERGTWGNNPFSYYEFKKKYRCLRSQKFILQPGDQRHIKTNFVYNRTFSRNEIFFNGTSWIGNCTVIPYIIARSGMVGFSSSDGGDTGEVSYGAPKVGIIHTQTIRMRALPLTRQSVSRVLNCLVENDTADYQKVVDADDDEKQEQGAAAWHI